MEVACAGTTLAAYTCDGRSRRTALDYANGASIAYEYDAASRLLTLDNQANSGYLTYDYTYDKVGNRMTGEEGSHLELGIIRLTTRAEAW